jgi:hypothetical protein
MTNSDVEDIGAVCSATGGVGPHRRVGLTARTSAALGRG